MNYFIDFEATQFSSRIISIGIVREDGKEFYSLVNPDRKITPFITKLTGITQADVDAAPSADKVFSDLYDYFAEDETIPKVYCYGGGDVDFTRSSFDKMVTNFKAASTLGFLTTGMVNFAPIAKCHFGVAKDIGLSKIANYYRGEDIVQNHNALEDAKLLKYVYEQIQCHEFEFEAFPEYKVAEVQQKIVKTDNKAKARSKPKIIGYRVHRMKNGKVNISFQSLDLAIQWVIDRLPEGQKSITNPDNIGKNIKKSSDNHTPYFKCRWIVEPIFEGERM